MNVLVQGVRIHLTDAGKGHPTLFIHGNPDSSLVWRDVIAKMQHHGRCIAPDLPSFGDSEEMPHLDTSLDGMAQWVDDFITALQIQTPINLVVHDIGGVFGLSFMVKYPDKVNKLAIINSLYHSDYKWHSIGRVLRTPILGEVFMAISNRMAMRSEMRRGSSTLINTQIDEVYHLMTPKMKRMALKLYRAITPSLLKGYWESSFKELTRTRIPTLVLWGDKDPYLPKVYADQMNAKLVKHYPQWGHWIMVESPQTIADELISFFDNEVS